MGLERIAAVLQHVHANYEIDLFKALIAAAAREVYVTPTNKTYSVATLNELTSKHPEVFNIPSLKVLADHIRACSFLIADGVIPGNEGRGYVLRRIIRRAIRHGYKLGVRASFFYKIVPDLVNEMGGAYPELLANKTRVMDILLQEEDRFFTTLASGMHLLDSVISPEHFTLKWLELKTGWKYVSSNISGWRSISYEFDGLFQANGKEVPVEVVFTWSLNQRKLDRLFQAIYAFKDDRTFSDYNEMALIVVSQNANEPVPESVKSLIAGSEFPIRLFQLSLSELEPLMVLRGDIAFKLHATYGFPLDLTQDVCRERNVIVDIEGFNAELRKDQEQARAAGKFKMATNLEYKGVSTAFKGYETLEDKGQITALYKDGVAVNVLSEGEQGVVVLDNTPFYAESGGQIGDCGELKGTDGIFAVEDTQKIQAAVFGHHGILKTGSLKVGEQITAKVSMQARAATMRNHSATHLMHQALRDVLGEHVLQKGSLVDTEKTRFDFVHNAPITDADIAKVEQIVNAEILANAATQARIMSIDDAKQTGAMMLFGEKYGDEVRVLDIGTTRELCGGTHVSRTGDIGLFKIYSESGVAAGVRRVEATTGTGALKLINTQQALINQLAGDFKAPPAEILNKVAQLTDHAKALEKELARLKSKLASSQGDDLVSKAIEIDGVKVLAATLEGADANALRETMDKLKDKLKTAAIVLASVNDGKVSLAAGVTQDVIAKIKAGDLVNFVAQQVGGKGGGKPDMAMAGGTDASQLPKALASVQEWVTQKLN